MWTFEQNNENTAVRQRKHKKYNQDNKENNKQAPVDSVQSLLQPALESLSSEQAMLVVVLMMWLISMYSCDPVCLSGSPWVGSLFISWWKQIILGHNLVINISSVNNGITDLWLHSYLVSLPYLNEKDTWCCYFTFSMSMEIYAAAALHFFLQYA